MALKFSFPEIPFRAAGDLTTSTAATGNPLSSTVKSDRALYFKLSATGTFLRIRYDLGVGNSEVIDHMIIGRFDYVQNGGASFFILYGSTDDITYPTIINIGLPAAYSDIRSQDILYDYGGSSTSYRYWRISSNTSPVGLFPISAIHFGLFFNLDQTPIEWTPRVDQDTTRLFETDSGRKYTKQTDYPRRTWFAKWTGITDAKTEAFYNKCAPFLIDERKIGLFLYDDSGLNEFFGAALQHVWMEDINIERTYTDYNTITATITEQIG